MLRVQADFRVPPFAPTKATTGVELGGVARGTDEGLGPAEKGARAKSAGPAGVARRNDNRIALSVP
jgi:hypothetical protein